MAINKPLQVRRRRKTQSFAKDRVLLALVFNGSSSCFPTILFHTSSAPRFCHISPAKNTAASNKKWTKTSEKSLKRCINQKQSLQSFSLHNSTWSRMTKWMKLLQSNHECNVQPGLNEAILHRNFSMCRPLTVQDTFLRQPIVSSSEKQCQNLEFHPELQSPTAYPHQHKIDALIKHLKPLVWTGSKLL